MQNIIFFSGDSVLTGIFKTFISKTNYEIKVFQPFENYPEIIDDCFVAVIDADDSENAVDLVKKSGTPFIIVKSDNYDEYADVFIKKPFSMAKLLEHINDFNDRIPKEKSKYYKTGLIIDKNEQTAFFNGVDLRLTSKEFLILCCLFENIGKIVSRDILLCFAWPDNLSVDERTVDSHLTRLRAKLGSWGNDHLHTVYGKGYRLEIR